MNRTQAVRLLTDPSAAGVFRASSAAVAELLETAAAAGFATCRVDLSLAAGKNVLLDSLADAFVFPDWFGRNWDALADCLCDLSWLSVKGYLLQLEGVEAFRLRNGRDLDIALGILSSAAAYWRRAGVPFWVLTDSGADGTPLFRLPV